MMLKHYHGNEMKKWQEKQKMQNKTQMIKHQKELTQKEQFKTGLMMVQ
jgi:hypothetical protein